MKILNEFTKEKLAPLKPFLPYGVLESWEDLDPRLYHAVHIYWLKFYGLWYNTVSKCSFRFWTQIVYGFLVLWLVCFLPGIGEVVYLLRRRDNIGEIAEGLYLFLSEMYTYIKLSALWLKKNEIIDLLEYLHREEFKPSEPEHREILRKSIKTARMVMTYYSSICVGAVSVSGHNMPLIKSSTNVEYPYFDVYKSPAYGIIYIHHIYYKPATCIIDGVMDTILSAFIASAIGQIEILAFTLRNFNLVAERRRKRFARLGDIKSDQSTRYYVRSVFKDIIKHHNSIIRYVSLIESAFSLASALQLMLSVMVLCLVGIQFLSIEKPMSHPIQIAWMAIYLTCMLIEVFIICWFGDELIWKSKELSQAAFDAPWPTTDPKTAMFIIIFMERCKRPLQVTAGKIFTLSLNTYTNLINWAYKAFAVMRKMKK
ncbi:odorant receptor 2a-like [Choristoneura fumiferana]|uniref:odorant receptor 2a-like n=1 Tax=Choristoneura fumiferana TaxID=7141 RepID=UPI003D15BF66